MSGYRLSRKAVADLSGIWDYTAEHWGVEQAERYIGNIRDACKALASRRQRGQDASHIRHGYRKQLTGAHVLFFRTLDDGCIDVVRILHQRMDAGQHL
ncbi:type II toxin-antitoxin system RelE/ParE family toxin [Thauera butanivorans]|uniref:type II toxin-antitoxin system RelE/ParE family toxin n=1 Tax=Thauera butanivorans TaxID=86174 RepID=UPI000837AB33|nr:type II toxin-antitoxin system RelE/ParE family toxin [Thauera butanivorans]